MVPVTRGGILGPAPVVQRGTRPSRTYGIDFAAGRVRGMSDGREAVAQAVHLALSTQRFAHLIYSWGYGMEWDRLQGRGLEEVQREAGRLIAEALAQDERVTRVSQVTVECQGRDCQIWATVETIFGTVREELTLNV